MGVGSKGLSEARSHRWNSKRGSATAVKPAAAGTFSVVRIGRFFVLVRVQMQAHNRSMKTVRQQSSLIGCVLLLVFATSAFAESTVTRISRSSRRADRKMCFALIGSGIPQPCDRF